MPCHRAISYLYSTLGNILHLQIISFMYMIYYFVLHGFLLCILCNNCKWAHLISFVAFSSNPSQSIERTFQLLRSDRDLLSKQEYDIQVGHSAMQWQQPTFLYIWSMFNSFGADLPWYLSSGMVHAS